MTAKLADGVPFVLGMKIFLPIGGARAECHDIRTIETSPDTHEIETFDFEGAVIHCVQRKGSRCGADLLRFYSSMRAATLVCYRDAKLKMLSYKDTASTFQTLLAAME